MRGGGGGEGGMCLPHLTFVVFASVIMKLGTGIKLDVFYTMVTKSLWRHYYYIIMTSLCSYLPNCMTNLAESWYLEVFSGVCFKYQVRFYF